MSITPDSHSAWSGSPPLKSGLCIQRPDPQQAEVGTLSVAVTFDSGTYFATARHVVGNPPDHVEAMPIYRSTGKWEPTNALQLLTPELEPGAQALLGELDLSFMKAGVAVQNVPPDAARVSASIGVATEGADLWIRGCRHPRWIQTTYLRAFEPEDEADFLPGLRRDHAGIVDLTPLGAASDQPGNSGSALWLRVGDVWCAVGHLVAVSKRAPKGLIVLYRSAFEALGFGMTCVVTNSTANAANLAPVPA